MTKEILFNEEARVKIKQGLDFVANAVKVSLGAAGKTVLIGGDRNAITKDGYLISKSISFSDPYLSIGAETIKKVTKKTVELVGDSTTATTILTQAIVEEGFKLLSARHKGQHLKKGIDKAVDAVVAKLNSMAELIDINSPKVTCIAEIAANGDSEISRLVTEAFVKTGKDGARRLEDSTTGKSWIDVKEGMILERGFLTGIFINNDANLSCELFNPYVLITEGKISTLKDIKNIMDNVGSQGRGILMIAEDFDGEALYTINSNRLKGNYPICLIKAPGFGDNQKEYMKDIAAVVGANIASDETGLRLDKLRLTDLGSAEKIVITEKETAILKGSGLQHDIDARVMFVRKSIELSTADDVYGKMLLEQRLAKLTGGVAIIYVGAPTETELGELKDRYEDALKSTDAAISEGVVVGGGIALIRCIDVLDELEYQTDDEKEGIKLIQRVLSAPFRQMVANAGIELSVKELKNDNPNYGYNFRTEQFEDLFANGVIDALKVVRVSFVNAASTASTLLTTDAVVIPEKSEMPSFLPPQMRR